MSSTSADLSLRQRAYQHLQQKIVCGELPAGTKISELSVAKEIGISRTPVREAINRLQAEGLVEQVPKLGTLVRAIDRRDLIDLFEMRQALETFAAGRAAEDIDEPQVTRLRVVCDAMQDLADAAGQSAEREIEPAELGKFLALDMAFHGLVIEASGNRRVAETVAQTRMLSSIFRTRRQTHSGAVLARACADHWAIVDALAAHDAERARQRVADHIAMSMRQALEHFDRIDARQRMASTIALNLPAEVAQRIEQAQRDRHS